MKQPDVSDSSNQRINEEIEHGKYLLESGAGEIWGWESAAGQLRWRRRAEMLLRGIEPEMKILEIGCGSGYFTKELVKTGARITAIDISPDLIGSAKKSISAANVEFQVENAYATKFPSESFDGIVGCSVLHHLEVDQALSEFKRLLKPGGFLTFSEPNMLNPQIAVQKNIPWIKKRMGDSPSETAFFRWSLESRLSGMGFKEIKIEPFDFLHPSCPRVAIDAIEKLGSLLEKTPLFREIAGSLFISAHC